MHTDYDLTPWTPERFSIGDVARGKYLALRASTAGRPLTDIDAYRLDNLLAWIQRTNGVEGMA